MNKACSVRLHTFVSDPCGEFLGLHGVFKHLNYFKTSVSPFNVINVENYYKYLKNPDKFQLIMQQNRIITKRNE